MKLLHCQLVQLGQVWLGNGVLSLNGIGLTTCKDDWAGGGWPRPLGGLHHDHGELFDTLSDGLWNATVVIARSVELQSTSPVTWT